jgi:hypothetical protein
MTNNLVRFIMRIVIIKKASKPNLLISIVYLKLLVHFINNLLHGINENIYVFGIFKNKEW